MFFSIPKEFFVPVIFQKGFVLNSENNNMELDTNNCRENTATKNTEVNLKKQVLENKNYSMGKETKECNSGDLDILKEIDDEYIDGEMKVTKKCY